MRTSTRRPLILPGILFLTACASQRGDVVPTLSATSGAPACTTAAPLPERLLQASGVVLFGELHGAAEIPSFFGEAVCTAAASPLPI